MVALSARTGGSRHTGLAALPHENNQSASHLRGQQQILIITKRRCRYSGKLETACLEYSIGLPYLI